MKKSKVQKPDWILEGYDSKEAYEKAKGIKSEKKQKKAYKIKICPKCKSNNVGIVLSGNDYEEERNTGREWECRKCKWKGESIGEKELSENEFMKYLDDKGEEIP